MICERCGYELRIGDFPFCRGEHAQHIGRNGGIVTDEIPGGVVIENLGATPIRVDSHSERMRIAKAQGLREPTRADLPDSKGVVSWATMDAYTLDAAKALVSRGVRVDAPDPNAVVRVDFEHGEYSKADARAMIESLT